MFFINITFNRISVDAIKSLILYKIINILFKICTTYNYIIFILLLRESAK